jgi:hypothetical protein
VPSLCAGQARAAAPSFLKDFPKGVSMYRYLLNQGLIVEAALLKMGADWDYMDRWLVMCDQPGIDKTTSTH